MQEELNILIQAQYPLIYLVTAEEDRAGKEIAKIAQNKQQPRKLYIWTQNSGMVEYGRDPGIAIQPSLSSRTCTHSKMRQE
jgi:hypothetical protein